MMQPRRATLVRMVTIVLSAIAASTSTLTAAVDDYPSKPIRLVVPT